MSPRLVNLLKQGIRAIDWILRQAYRVRPLSDNPECILRISPGRAKCDLALSDGAPVRAGDRLVQIHLWNERWVDLTDGELALGWGGIVLHRLKFSLRQLATRLSDDAAWREASAVCGELSFVTDPGRADRLFKVLGFDLFLVDRPGLRIWRSAFWENLYASWLMLAYGPASLRHKRLEDLNRVQIWMSRDRLIGRYASHTTRIEDDYPPVCIPGRSTPVHEFGRSNLADKRPSD